MQKVLNIIGYVFILLVFALAVVLVVFRLQIFAYLNKVNHVTDPSTQATLNANDLGIQVDQNNNSLDMDIINSDKFKALQAVKVDLTGLNLPNQSTTTASTTSSTVSFPVGNTDPFKAF